MNQPRKALTHSPLVVCVCDWGRQVASGYIIKQGVIKHVKVWLEDTSLIKGSECFDFSRARISLQLLFWNVSQFDSPSIVLEV